MRLHLRIGISAAFAAAFVVAKADDHASTQAEPTAQQGVASLVGGFRAGFSRPGKVGVTPAAWASSVEPSPGRLGASIAAAANVSLMEAGTAAAREAILECLRGDYPGGGMGVLSLPFARVSARTDHCRR